MGISTSTAPFSLSSGSVTPDKLSSSAQQGLGSYTEKFSKVAIQTDDWTETVSGGGAIAEQVDSQTIKLTSSVTANGTAKLELDNYKASCECDLNTANTITLEWRMKLTSFANNRWTMYWYSTAGTEHMNLTAYESYAAGKIKMHQESGAGNEDSAETALGTMGSWHTYKVVIIKNTGTYFYQDNVLIVSLNTVVDVPDTLGLYPYWTVMNKDGSTNCTMDLSWVRLIWQ